MARTNELEREVELRTTLEASAESSFYRDLWRVRGEGALLTKGDLLRTPLRERTYRRGPGFVRLVLSPEGHIMQKILRDAALLQIQLTGKRPFILCGDDQCALELMMRSLGSHALPFLGERRLLQSSSRGASAYGADVALLDPRGAEDLAEQLRREPFPLSSAIIFTEGPIGSTEAARIRRGFTIPVRFELSSPETGHLGSLCESADGMFAHASPECVLRECNGTLVATTLDEALAAPLFSFDTGMPVRPATCSTCGKEGFLLM